MFVKSELKKQGKEGKRGEGRLFRPKGRGKGVSTLGQRDGLGRENSFFVAWKCQPMFGLTENLDLGQDSLCSYIHT